MADLEKVIRGLECVICPNKFCGDCSYFIRNENDPDTGWCNRDAIYKAALSLLKAYEPGWISVKDRLPDSNRFVLVCNDDGHMMIAQYIEETAQWQYKYINYDVDIWDDEEQGPVCWWAELPEPPKEGT